MRRNMTFEISWVPYLSDQLRKSFRKESLEIEDIRGVFFIFIENEKIPQIWNPAQGLNDHINVICAFDVV